MKTLRDFIDEQLDARKMTKEAFADYVGVGLTTIVRATSDTNESDPSVDFLYKLSKATEIDLCTLVSMVKPDATLIRPEARVLAQRITQLPPEQHEMVEALLLGLLRRRVKN